MDRFVVGTGRCGSTLLTRMLSCHRDLVGLNEVFTGLDWGRRFTAEPVDGAEVTDILGTPNHVIQAVMARGHRAEEVTYPFRASDRFAPGDAIPWILTSTLGHLSDDPDAHWDELSQWLAGRDSAPVASHYRALFEYLAAGSGASAWVERSGSSIDYVGDLLDCFACAPDETGATVPVRVVHIHRPGVEVALSMRNHAFYRLAVQLYYGVVPEAVDTDDDEAVIDGWLSGDPPVELFGRYWSEQLQHGEVALAALGSDRAMSVAFEDLLADPGGHMERIAGFLGLARDPAFCRSAASLIRGGATPRASVLSRSERSSLEAACAPGDAVLGRLGAA